VACRFRIVELDSAKKRLKTSKRFQQREPLRLAVASLTPGRAIELAPEQGESLRKLKLDLARAAKEVGRDIAYGETADAMLIAWLRNGNGNGNGKGSRRRAGRMVDGADADAAASTDGSKATNVGNDHLLTSELFAAARARGEQAKHEILAEQGDMLTAAEVAIRLGYTATAVERRRQDGLLLALPLEAGDLGFPAWQFTDRGLLPGLEDVLQSMSVRSPWMRAQFFLTGDLRLDGETPLGMLRRGNVDAVRRAGAAYGEQLAS
jgi:hypothetical protein